MEVHLIHIFPLIQKEQHTQYETRAWSQKVCFSSKGHQQSQLCDLWNTPSIPIPLCRMGTTILSSPKIVKIEWHMCKVPSMEKVLYNYVFPFPFFLWRKGSASWVQFLDDNGPGSQQSCIFTRSEWWCDFQHLVSISDGGRAVRPL
jgi:hypothetical protein